MLHVGAATQPMAAFGVRRATTEGDTKSLADTSTTGKIVSAATMGAFVLAGGVITGVATKSAALGILGAGFGALAGAGPALIGASLVG